MAKPKWLEPKWLPPYPFYIEGVGKTVHSAVQLGPYGDPVGRREYLPVPRGAGCRVPR